MRYAMHTLAVVGLLVSPWLAGCGGESPADPAPADPVPAAPASQPAVQQSSQNDPTPAAADATWIVYTLPG